MFHRLTLVANGEHLNNFLLFVRIYKHTPRKEEEVKDKTDDKLAKDQVHMKTDNVAVPHQEANV